MTNFATIELPLGVDEKTQEKQRGQDGQTRERACGGQTRRKVWRVVSELQQTLFPGGTNFVFYASNFCNKAVISENVAIHRGLALYESSLILPHRLSMSVWSSMLEYKRSKVVNEGEKKRSKWFGSREERILTTSRLNCHSRHKDLNLICQSYIVCNSAICNQMIDPGELLAMLIIWFEPQSPRTWDRLCPKFAAQFYLFCQLNQ